MIDQTTTAKIFLLRDNNQSMNTIACNLNITRRVVSYHLAKKYGPLYTIKKVNTHNLLQDSEFLGEFLGIFCADGNFYYDHKYKIRFFFSLITEHAYARFFYERLCLTLDKKPLWLQKQNCIVIQYASQELYNILVDYLCWKGRKSESISLKTMDHPKHFLMGFIRGYFDSDGYTDKNHRQVTMFTISHEMAKQLSSILTRLEFKNSLFVKHKKMRSPLYYIALYGENAQNFVQFIKPNNFVRIRNWCAGAGRIRTAVSRSLSGKDGPSYPTAP